MPKIYVECQYCGKAYDEYLYSLNNLEDLSCRYCKDRKLKIKQNEPKKDVFGYNNKRQIDAYIRGDSDYE